MGAIVLLLAAGAGAVWLTTSRAVPVTMGQAESRLRPDAPPTDLGARPSPGVYHYVGSGTDRLSLPPLSQPEGPTMPGTVTLVGPDCWNLRIDYSSHHWQTWAFCVGHGALRETGGGVWQLWSIGPLRVTNLTTLACTADSVWLPDRAVPGAHWRTSCSGTSTAVHGRMTTAGSDRFVGVRRTTIGGRTVTADVFRQVRTDSGAQRGSEVSNVWLDNSTGLPLRLTEDITVVTATPFGTSTYTQRGAFHLASLTAFR